MEHDLYLISYWFLP